MKKVGLCIVYKNWNYGSILQSYATLLKFQELGVEYEIIRYERARDLNFYLTALPRLINRDMLYSKARKMKQLTGKKMHPEFAAHDSVRVKAFKDFVDSKFDSFSDIITGYSSLCKYTKKFQSVVVGSDQLWLPSGLATNFFNLMFVPDGINKIAYAASFGVSKIPFYQKKRTAKYLNRIEHISVREYSGQAIIQELTKRDVPVIVDPTLAIEKDFWDVNIPYERKIKEDYIFCYFLGNNREHRYEAERLSKQTGLKIVTLRHMDEYIESDESFGDYAPYDVGPIEFVNLIRYASYVCTDSFHGSVFSIIYHKKFITFSRYGNGNNSRNSRLDSLFSQIGIERGYKGNIVKDMYEDIDYDLADKNLKRLRSFANNYLINALEVTD